MSDKHLEEHIHYLYTLHLFQDLSITPLDFQFPKFSLTFIWKFITLT